MRAGILGVVLCLVSTSAFSQSAGATGPAPNVAVASSAVERVVARAFEEWDGFAGRVQGGRGAREDQERRHPERVRVRDVVSRPCRGQHDIPAQGPLQEERGSVPTCSTSAG